MYNKDRRESAEPGTVYIPNFLSNSRARCCFVEVVVTPRMVGPSGAALGARQVVGEANAKGPTTGGRRLSGDPVRLAGSGQRDHGVEGPPSTPMHRS